MKKTSIIKETIIALLLTLVFAVSTATTAMAAENHVIRLSDKEETSSSDNRLFSKLLEKLLACKTIPGEIELDESMQVEIRKYLEETEPTKKSRSITGNDLYWELDDYTLYLNFDRELFLITPSESIFEISFGFLANADSNKPDGSVSFENVTYISNENGFSVWEFGKEKIRYQIDGLNNPQFEGWHSGVGHIYMHSGNNFGYFEPKLKPSQWFAMITPQMLNTTVSVIPCSTKIQTDILYL